MCGLEHLRSKEIHIKVNGEYISCRIVYLLVLAEFQYNVIHGMSNVKVSDC
jgi:hypothetical protein